MTAATNPRPWVRELWGVMAHCENGEPFLLTSTWEEFLSGRRFYEGEPPRCLVFTTRTAARKCIAARNIVDPANGKKWRFRPVRVRETVRQK